MKIVSDKKYVPKAHIRKIQIGKKEFDTFSFFPTLKRAPKLLTETFDTLKKHGFTEVLPHIGGFIVESQDIPNVILKKTKTSDENKKQRTLRGKKLFIDNMKNKDMKNMSFYDFLSSYSKLLLIDPNLDKITYASYRSKFIDNLSGYFPKEVLQSLEGFKIRPGMRDSERERHKDTVFDTIYSNRVDLVQKFANLQIDLEADAFISPYIPISFQNINTDVRKDKEDSVDKNIKIHTIMKEITFEKKDVFPVICLRRNILKETVKNVKNKKEYPKSWVRILDEYNKLDSNCYGLKIVDFNTDNNSIDKKNYEGLFEFYKYLRTRIVDKPVFLLNMNEFSYILYSEGLDFFSHPIYKKVPETRGGIGEKGKKPETDRYYYLPRKMTYEKIGSLSELKCNCPFCSPFSDFVPKELNISLKDKIRYKHFLWCKNYEVKEILAETKKNALDVALGDMFKDSDWLKNLIKFLRD